MANNKITMTEITELGRARHVLGLSGGKDSAALAIYIKDRYPKYDLWQKWSALDDEFELAKHKTLFTRFLQSENLNIIELKGGIKW